MIQTIRVSMDRVVTPSRLIVGNRLENGVERIQFIPPAELIGGYRYLILNKPNGEASYPVPLDQDGFFYVDSNVTYVLEGIWVANFVMTKSEIVQNQLNPESFTFISDDIILVVKKNRINKAYLDGLPLPQNLQIVYDKLFDTYSQIKADYDSGALNGKDGYSPTIQIDPTDGGHKVTVTDVNGSHTFDVIDGASAYDLAVKNGFKGTEKEWLESLKYDHSDEFTALSNQVKQDAQSSAENADKAEQAMNQANQTAQANLEAIQTASQTAQRDINTAKQDAVNSVTNAQEAAEQSISAKHNEAVQAIESAQSTAESALNAKQTESVQAVATAKEEATSEITTAKTGALESIDTAKKEAIEEIENTGVPLEDIEKLAIKENAEGNPTIISDSADWRLQKLSIYGQSEQDSTTGKNLFDVSKVDKFESYSNGRISNFGTLPKGSYVISMGDISADSRKDGYFAIEVGKFSYWFIHPTEANPTLPKGAPFTIEEDTTLSANIHTSTQEQFESFISLLKDNIQIESGGTKTSWEPYTGGKPSPSPDYPQEIISKEVSEIKVTGKNILDPNVDKFKLVPLELKKGTILTLVYKEGTVSDGGNILFRGTDGSNVWFGIDKGKSYSRIVLGKDVIGYYNRLEFNNHTNACLAIGENDTFEPYKAQTITLAEPITLRGIPVSSGGNVTIDRQHYISDVITEKDGVVGVDRNIIVLSPSDGIVFKQTPDVPNRVIAANVFNVSTPPKNGGRKSLSTHFVWKAWGFDNNNKEWLFTIDAKSMYISPPEKEVDYTKEELESLVNSEWVKIKNDVKFFAQLSKPTFEPLPEDIQSQIKALKTYYPNTNIDTGAWTKVEYVADTKMYIQKKVDELNVSLVTTQAELLNKE